jgi:hypothetical protein
MNRSALFVFAAVIGSTGHVQAQGLLQSIVAPEKAVAVVNQSMEGTWVTEARPAGAPADAPPILNFSTYHPDGNVVLSASNGNQGEGHGLWLRVGDRKFLATLFFFIYDANRVVINVIKSRVNLELSLDGKTIKSTNEVVIMDPTGKILTTIGGGTGTGVRLSPEIPADFNDFQKLP